jgi:hypothetical protein
MFEYCDIEDCAKPQDSFLDGKPLCNKHYTKVFMAELNSMYQGWAVGTEPGSRFRNPSVDIAKSSARCTGTVT